MVDVYIPKFMGKEMCSHAYSRQSEVWSFILQDVKERFIDTYDRNKYSKDDMKGIDRMVSLGEYSTTDDSKEIMVPFEILDELEDLLDRSNLVNNIGLVNKINKIFENSEKDLIKDINYSMRTIKVLNRYHVSQL